MPPPTILLVDDYVDALDVWALFLRSAGFDVQTATDGREALAQAEATRPDLIVLDLELPGISGLEVARILRSRPETSRIPMIAATGHSHSAEIDQARRIGFDTVLVKPCDPELVVREIKRLLNDRAIGDQTPE